MFLKNPAFRNSRKKTFKFSGNKMGIEVAGSISVLLLVVVFCCSCISSLDVRLPPSITDPPIESKIFRDDESVTLNCVASGVPPPEYEWFKNDKILTLHTHQNIQQLPEGTIKIDPLTSLDAGVYQCSASNQYGKTFSLPSVLQRAMGPDISSTARRTIEAQSGKNLTIECNQAKCFPKPSYSWALSPSEVSPDQTALSTSRRVQIDHNGNLHFAYVEPSDVQDDKLYKCNIFNPYSDVTKGTSYTKLTLKQDGSPIQPFGPVLQFSSGSNFTALEGTNVSLRCFFAGYPLPQEIIWTSESGLVLARGRSQIVNQYTELTIRNVKQEDEETYFCTAGGVRHSIRLDVHAVPVFRSIKNRPHDVNVTEGDDVTVVCDAYAIPPADVTWFINGVKHTDENLPPRFKILKKTRLIVSSACRDCPGTSDIKVIQCNASNIHGAVYSSGFINVLKRTEMTVIPIDVTVNSSDTFASFNCSGTSDDSTPVSVKWYKLASTGSYLPVEEIPGQVVVERNGTLSFLLSNKSSWAEHAGQYNGTVSNGYSAQSKVVLLTFEGSSGPLVETAAFPWWIILILLLAILLLLLLICCCCYFMRNKGATYLVDEKEQKNGNNPEKELVDNDFQDYVPFYRRPDVRASPASMRKSLSDDDRSLNEYGDDIDAGKFTEDGSFIGDYNDRPYV